MKRLRLSLKYDNFSDVLLDKNLAKLGDAFVNFVYSLVASTKRGEPTGVKVKSKILAEALKRAGLRSLLPNRIDKHTQADAVEAIMVYSWLQDIISIEECIEILSEDEDPVEAFTNLLYKIMKK